MWFQRWPLRKEDWLLRGHKECIMIKRKWSGRARKRMEKIWKLERKEKMMDVFMFGKNNWTGQIFKRWHSELVRFLEGESYQSYSYPKVALTRMDMLKHGKKLAIIRYVKKKLELVNIMLYNLQFFLSTRNLFLSWKLTFFTPLYTPSIRFLPS